MANVTDPLIKSVQGSDPQNLMEYITRQKIYDSRFWKEECFGLTAADVMERAAKVLTCVGGTYSGMGKPSKFLALTLKLLQLQPDLSVVQAFLEQDHFKYLKVLGAFYLRLTGRPQEIYELLDPLYADYSKLKYRDVNEWKLIHVDEFVDDLLTKNNCCGIAMPRLPRRETLQEAGYLEDGPRLTALQDKLLQAGGIKEYLQQKVDQEQAKQSSSIPGPSKAIDTSDPTSATALWERRYGKVKKHKKEQPREKDERIAKNDELGGASVEERPQSVSREKDRKRKYDSDEEEKRKRKKKKEKKSKYGSLFKASAVKDEQKEAKTSSKTSAKDDDDNNNKPVDQNSEEYWNELRSSLGMNPLKK
eukprot:CAMPEP_0116124534 /NCGR_PEP_ID=MMETSP0329-20121206/5329_1 /TAXON_ID=697910 /ORGANISM="Pseudo-nitzschia arenysensis, Strain B593" /LENGTH=361 /DNA_ID=CAMNT_0003618515 /DNA_START=5 /DNA_END=1090 /DNA_ORIENTATION=-